MRRKNRIMIEAESFGLAFNCMIRLYRKNYQMNVLKDIKRVCDRFLPCFSRRTVAFALRDFRRIDKQNHGNSDITIEQLHLFLEIKERLKDQSLCLRHYEELFSWNEKETWKLEEEDMPLVCMALYYMIEYSYGRHSYMPSTCSGFLIKNIALFADTDIEKIKKYIDYLFESNPDTEQGKEIREENIWIRLSVRLREELIFREACRQTENSYKDIREFEAILRQISDEETHINLENWQESCIWCQGIECFLNTLSDRNKKKQACLQAYHPIREKIIEKRNACWDLEYM